jgi:hypothetical protein
MTTWQPGQPVPPGYCTVIEEDGSERLTESWPTSPGSEPVEEGGNDAWQESGAPWTAQERGHHGHGDRG